MFRMFLIYSVRWEVHADFVDSSDEANVGGDEDICTCELPKDKLWAYLDSADRSSFIYLLAFESTQESIANSKSSRQRNCVVPPCCAQNREGLLCSGQG